MRQPQIYLTRGLVVRGTPVDRDDFEELTGRKVARRDEDVHFLQDVTVLGGGGPLVEVAFMILDKASVHGVGRGQAQSVAPGERTALY